MLLELSYKRCDVYEKIVESLLLLLFKFIFTEFLENKIELNWNDVTFELEANSFSVVISYASLQSSTRVGE